MRSTVATLTRRHPIRAAALMAVVLGALLFGTSEVVRWIQWCAFANLAESVASVPPSGDARYVTLRFDASGSRCELLVAIDTAEYEALSRLPAEEAFRYRGRWRERYVTTLVDALADSRFISRLASQLDDIADKRRLDSDEHLELLVAAVQSVRYDKREGPLRTPIEVIAEREGICTERSILLAALMVHEGYETVMWSFRDQAHVALGVATPGPSYRDTGYAFIETTRPARIGEVDPKYRGAGPVYDPPQRIVFRGTKRYGSAHRVPVLAGS